MNEPSILPPAAVACGVSFDGRAYHYQGYSYERLPDALAYAKLDQARPGLHEGPAALHWKQWAAPTPKEQLHMQVYGIRYEHGHYCYGPYRYDLLSAALAYARHEPRLSHPGSQEEA